MPASRLPPTVTAKWAKIGAIMNAATARNSSTIANTRWRLAEASEKPATKSAGRDRRAEADAGETGADQRAHFARGHCDGEDRDPGRQEHHPDEREVVERAPVEHHAEQDRGQHRAADLRAGREAPRGAGCGAGAGRPR